MKSAGNKEHGFLAIIPFCFALFTAQSLMGQTFVGEILYQDSYQYVKLKCANDTCWLSIPYLDGNTDYPVPVDLANAERWEVNRGIEKWIFDTKLTAGELRGKLTLPSGERELFLRKQARAVAKNDLSKFSGTYVGDDGHTAIVYDRFDYLHLMTPFSEKTVGLKPMTERTFWSVSGETSRFENLESGKYAKLIIADRLGNEHVMDRRPDFEVTTVRPIIENDTLHGELYKPSGDGPFPSVLILPGGGNRPQIDNFRFEARYFASIGMAAMIFDKPGVGESTGLNFDGLTFVEKADYYGQIFDYFRDFDFVDAGKTGVHGSSEGGRLSLVMAINKPDQIAFVNAVAAPIMTMREGQLYAMDHYQRNLGLSEELIMESRQIWKHYYAGISADTISPEYTGRIEEIRARYPRAFLPPSATAIPLSPNKHDLQDDLVARQSSKIKCPVLLQYGENDQRVHANASIRNFFSNGANRDLVNVQIYNRGSHSMMTPEYMICPGYMVDKGKWLEVIGVLNEVKGL